MACDSLPVLTLPHQKFFKKPSLDGMTKKFNKGVTRSGHVTCCPRKSFWFIVLNKPTHMPQFCYLILYFTCIINKSCKSSASAPKTLGDTSLSELLSLSHGASALKTLLLSGLS